MLLPSKNSNLTVLRFTPIEEQFYRATLSNCRLRGLIISPFVIRDYEELHLI